MQPTGRASREAQGGGTVLSLLSCYCLGALAVLAQSCVISLGHKPLSNRPLLWAGVPQLKAAGGETVSCFSEYKVTCGAESTTGQVSRNIFESSRVYQKQRSVGGCDTVEVLWEPVTDLVSGT